MCHWLLQSRTTWRCSIFREENETAKHWCSGDQPIMQSPSTTESRECAQRKQIFGSRQKQLYLGWLYLPICLPLWKWSCYLEWRWDEGSDIDFGCSLHPASPASLFYVACPSKWHQNDWHNLTNKWTSNKSDTEVLSFQADEGSKLEGWSARCRPGSHASGPNGFRGWVAAPALPTDSSYSIQLSQLLRVGSLSQLWVVGRHQAANQKSLDSRTQG